MGEPITINGEYQNEYNKSLRIINIDGTNEIELANYDYRYFFLNKQFYFDDSKIYFTVEPLIHPIESDNGIWVVDKNGNRITLVQSIIRYFS